MAQDIYKTSSSLNSAAKVLRQLFRGNTLAMIGLFLGLTTGAIVLMAKHWLVNEIVTALEEEVVAACDCSLSFDSISLSFTTLRARARNVKILQRGVPRLTFKDIRAKVDISEIRERKVYLTSLVLNHGLADGVGPDSATFKFIDQLTAPLPPEKQRPDRWRVILDSLEVKNSFLRESFGSSEISGAGVSLYVKRIGENFSLLPTIADFRYTTYGDTPGEPPSELYLGPLTGSIVIEDERTVFNSLLLGRDRSRIEAKMETDTNRDNAAKGSTRFSITPDYIGLPEWLRGTISGTTQISGTLGSPLLTGTIQNSPGEALTLAIPQASQVTLPEFSSSLTIDVNHGDPVVTLSNINGVNAQTSLSSTRPLTFSDSGLAAGFRASLPNYSYGPFAVGSSNADINLDQERDEIVTSINLTTENLVGNGINLGPAKIAIRLDSDAVEINADSTNPAQGLLSWRGTIDLAADQPNLVSGLLKLRAFRYPTALPAVESNLSPIAITSDLSLKGPLAVNRLIGEGDTTLTFPSLRDGFPLSGRTTLKDGVLKVALPNSPNRASADLTVDFAKSLEGKLNFSLPQTPLRNLLGHDDPCSVVGGALNYTFSLAKVSRGTGELGLDSLSIGCKPYSLVLPNNSRIPIRDGALQLKNTSLSTLDSTLNLDGQVGIDAGFDMSARGRLELSSLLPLLPAIDDLQGMLKTDIIIKGQLREPTVTGSAQLTKGQFGVSSPDVGGDSITGDFTLAGKAIQIKSLTGNINNGTFSTSGTLLPFDPSHSTLQTTLKQVTIEPVEDATITFSADLRLGADRNRRQALAGEIDVSFAEVAKDFDINKIIMNTISGYFLPTRAQPTATKSKLDVDLDIKIGAPRNVFVVTPFLSAELNSQLHARGNASAPIIEGNMQILSGWIGLKGNRFDITSGGIIFKPPSLLPTLEISSEGTLRAPTGENVLVILEASGPLTSPKIALNSDRGLSQSELLLLLTSSRRLGESSIRGRMDSQFGADQRFFISDNSFSSIKDFFRNLTKLDILSFEPTYNQFTGTIEPAVVARKNISPRLTLLGESLFSSVSNSRAGAVYALTPSLDINGFFQTVSTQKNSILSSDLTYTVWSEESRFVTYQITGLKNFSEQSIYNAARLGPASRINSSQESIDGIQRQIVSYLSDQGYKNGSASILCQDADRYCHLLSISIDEGQPCTIDEILFEGGQLPANLVELVRDVAKPGDLATTSTLDTIERKLVVALRNDGYIAARITPSYRINSDKKSATLVVNAEPREPISFEFSGNEEFSSEDFLNSIELFSRKRPFGNNTINLLTQNIERMYQERGYLFVSVNYTEDRSDPKRLVYRIEIKEESPSKVKSLTLAGNSNMPQKRLTEVLREMGMSDQIELLSPEYAVPSQLDTLRDSILAAYQREGFPDATVTYSINQIQDTNNLEITFNIVEGSPRNARQLTVHGYPEHLKQPKAPPPPASLPKINNYIETLAESLKSEGYMHPAVFAEPNTDNSAIEIEIEPGSRTSIATVQYEGLIKIEEATAVKATSLRVGQPFRTEDINRTKRELLRTGLFSRVEVIANDGALDSSSEAITIRVVERPLQTLQLGVGANSEFGLHTFGEAVNKSLFADGRTLSLRVDTYFDQGTINPDGSDLISQGFTSARYVDPSLLGSDYSLTEEVRYQRQELSTQEFNLDRLLVGSYILRQPRPDLTFSAGHSLVLDNLQDVTPGAIISDLDNGQVRLSFLSGVVKLDKRDDPLLPRSGYTLSLEPKAAFEAIGSEANFISSIARATAILPLSENSARYSLGLGLSGGIAQPFGSTDEIPITQRFYLGGRTTVRGFRENSLGPRGSDGAVIGGNAMLAAKSQLQYLAADSLSTHLFFDAGNVFLLDNDEYEEISSNELRKSLGVGFQYLSPIGPIGFDIGRPLDEKSGEPSVRVHFSVGSMF